MPCNLNFQVAASNKGTVARQQSSEGGVLSSPWLQVLLTFEEPQEGTTILSLRHTSIPEADRFGNSDVVDNTRIGWQQQIFHKIKAVFGFGL